MVKLIVAGVLAVVYIIYLIFKAIRGESDFDSDSLKTAGIVFLMLIIIAIIGFGWLWYIGG